MQAHTLTINGDRFYLTDNHSITDLKTKLVDAVRQGGAFVDILGGARNVTALLITSTTVVKFESFDRQRGYGPGSETGSAAGTGFALDADTNSGDGSGSGSGSGEVVSVPYIEDEYGLV